MRFTEFEPKVSFRFYMYLNGWPTHLIKTTDYPDTDQSEIVIDHTNTDFKVKGKTRWQPITVTLYDSINDQTSMLVHEWLNAHHNSATGIDDYAFGGYKRLVKLEAVDPAHAPVESWLLYGCYAQTIGWGSGDWTADEAKEIELQLNYDYAIHT